MLHFKQKNLFFKRFKKQAIEVMNFFSLKIFEFKLFTV